MYFFDLVYEYIYFCCRIYLQILLSYDLILFFDLLGDILFLYVLLEDLSLFLDLLADLLLLVNKSAHSYVNIQTLLLVSSTHRQLDS